MYSEESRKLFQRKEWKRPPSEPKKWGFSTIVPNSKTLFATRNQEQGLRRYFTFALGLKGLELRQQKRSPGGEMTDKIVKCLSMNGRAKLFTAH